MGEKFVFRKLDEFDEEEYMVIDDLLLPSRGNTPNTQIDHVVVSIYGIFCIETKSHGGWIFGSANQKYWTQVIYKNKYRFYNPLYQNYAHIKALEDLFGQRLKAPIVSLVAFPCADKIKVDGTDMVGFVRDVKDKIAGYKDIIYSKEEFVEMTELLKSTDIKDKNIRKFHKEYVRDLKNK